MSILERFKVVILATWIISQALFCSLYGKDQLEAGIRDFWQVALESMVQNQHSLPRYVEAGYSPLGRSPVVDAVLGDPFYLPQYGLKVSKILKMASKYNSLYDLASSALVAGGIPLAFTKTKFTLVTPHSVPEKFLHNFGEVLGKKLYAYWLSFMQIYREAESVLDTLSCEEKEWLRGNYNAFFFGSQEKESEYAFFTTDSQMPLKFFRLAAKVDLAALAITACKLGFIVDDLYQHRDELATIRFKQKFIWEEQGLKFIISGLECAEHAESADFFIDLGGTNTFRNNAGGTEGIRAAALHIDLLGNNVYIGDDFVQGSGFLGVGVLASFSGNNSYRAGSYSQGCGFFGSGFLMNLEGNNRFELNFGGQSCALFGSSVLWNKKGGNTYLAHEGMAQGASSTLGVAFLVDNRGHDSYVSGVLGKGDSRFGGMGQGGSVGVRYDPWIGHPSFYGGVSFLYNGGGHNKFVTPWLGQGSSYFLGAGIAVVEGSRNEFTADYDAQGQGLHLSAGLLLQHGGKSCYKGGWGSIGVGGDRAVGMCISTGGNNRYEATDQSIGSARKPKALGVFIDMQGKNEFVFQKGCSANIQWPESPTEWPCALFLELGSENQYPKNGDGMKRGSNLRWGVNGHAIGVDTVIKTYNVAKAVFDTFPKTPRVPFPFDPSASEPTNKAYLPLKCATTESELSVLIKGIQAASYDERRKLYESIDLSRFVHPDFKIDLSQLLANPATIPEDQFNYAVLWAILNKKNAHLEEVIDALDNDLILSEYARKMAIIYVGTASTQNIEPLLVKLMLTDTSVENRAAAAYALANRATQDSLSLLKLGLENNLEAVRYNTAKGLQESTIPNVLALITPLFCDSSFYVRRAAAMTAISLHDKAGIPILLETFQYPTLDTEDNYGDNIYSDLAQYVGVNFGTDQKAWIQWWEGAKNTFEFPPAKEL